MKQGDLVIYSDQETRPELAEQYGIVIQNSWHGDWRMCSVLWSTRYTPSIHYKCEIQIITNKGIQHGELILAERKGSKRNGN
jgi:hypothetical protein